VIASDVSTCENNVDCDICSDAQFLNCMITRACSMHVRDDVCSELLCENTSGKGYWVLMGKCD